MPLSMTCSELSSEPRCGCCTWRYAGLSGPEVIYADDLRVVTNREVSAVCFLISIVFVMGALRSDPLRGSRTRDIIHIPLFSSLSQWGTDLFPRAIAPFLLPLRAR